MKRLSCSEMMRLLERHGWSVVRRGKHPIYGKPGIPRTTELSSGGRAENQ